MSVMPFLAVFTKGNASGGSMKECVIQFLHNSFESLYVITLAFPLYKYLGLLVEGDLKVGAGRWKGKT